MSDDKTISLKNKNKLKIIFTIFFLLSTVFLIALLNRDRISNISSSDNLAEITFLKLDSTQGKEYLNKFYKSAPDEIQNIANIIINGKKINFSEVNIDQLNNPYPIRIGKGPSRNILDDTLDFDRMDILQVFLFNGLDPNIDDNKILWAILEQWTPETDIMHRSALSLYINKGGAVDIVDSKGYSSLEIASTISIDTVILLIKNGADPWKQKYTGGLGLLERLSLHADIPFVLNMIEAISMIENLPVPKKTNINNTIGNLVDRFDFLSKEQPIEENHIKPKSEILQIARIVLNLSRFETASWGHIPQEFLDYEKAGWLD